MERVVAVIPARGGSKGLPGKNVALLGGRPLIEWTIECAQLSGCCDEILVSTDDNEIARVAKGLGAQVVNRPPELSADDSLVMDAVVHTVNAIGGAEILVLLQPTSPLRAPEDIRACVDALLKDPSVDSIATYEEASLNPWRAWRIENGTATTFVEGANPWLPRQSLPEAFQLNGAVYAIRWNRRPVGPQFVFGKTVAVVMPKARSIDIDDEIDLRLAELYLQKEIA
ncbi:cytidylyltransferase domain-containing protein [Microvenator marinus]|uniref:acylneuraminate cytidylyltransferase family protein n=1 Tax=Microvenator marinus TaxID=2600177 RepID=UPI00201B6C94|nr:acylneuraminate cytidylyltransferase family protein [Microvenator marinus]